MTDVDYDSVLKIVATKTECNDRQSLWHYIGLALKINVWGGIDSAINRLHAADRLFHHLQSLNHQIHANESLGVAASV